MCKWWVGPKWSAEGVSQKGREHGECGVSSGSFWRAIFASLRTFLSGPFCSEHDTDFNEHVCRKRVQI